MSALFPIAVRCLHWVAVPALVLTLTGPALSAEKVQFNRDVRPILAQHCFKCHDQDAAKGWLRLDHKPAMLKGGDSGTPAVVPGSSTKSPIVTAVTTEDEDATAAERPAGGDALLHPARHPALEA